MRPSPLAGHTVDVQPWEAALAYAYPEVRWRPQPVFQAYSAYTPSLDEANARLLGGDLAPERILWLAPPPATLSIDGRDPWFDAPTAKIEMLCRYMPLASASTWQILGRVPDRCAAAVPAGTVTASAGDEISVPANLPPGVLTMRVTGVADDLVSRMVTLLYKAPPWWLHRETRPSGG